MKLNTTILSWLIKTIILYRPCNKYNQLNQNMLKLDKEIKSFESKIIYLKYDLGSFNSNSDLYFNELINDLRNNRFNIIRKIFDGYFDNVNNQ
ncbi:MAG: hypothetical protein U0354_05530 [Candidatus Sericytochromatia bacterium]